jgi:hypothetical protein
VVSARLFGKDEFYEESAKNLVKMASIFAIALDATITDTHHLVSNYFETRDLSPDSWEFYVTVACVGTAFITIADYVPKEKGESICVNIGEELVQFHPNGCLALEILNSLLRNCCDRGMPFHNAVGGWLAINLLEKDQPDNEDMEAFSMVGATIQHEFGGWFKKK